MRKYKKQGRERVKKSMTPKKERMLKRDKYTKKNNYNSCSSSSKGEMT